MADTSQRQGATSFLADYWTDYVLNYAQVNYRLRNAITDFTSMTDGKVGENIMVPTLSPETAVNYTGIDGSSDDTSVTFTNDTDGQVTINCNQQPVVAKRISDVVAVQSKFDIFDGMAKGMGQGIAKYVDTQIASAIKSGGSGNDVQLGADTSVTDAEYETGVQGALSALLADDCPLDDGMLYLYCSPSMYSALLKSDDFAHANLRGDESNPNATGILGTIYGAKVISSSLWENGALSANEVEGSLFHSSSMGCAFSIEPNVKAQENVAHLATDVVASCCFGVAELNANLISNIKV